MTTLEDTLEDAATGTRVVLRKTSSDTEGRAVVVEMFLAPHARKPLSHVHPKQEERIDVLHGSVVFRVGRRTGVAAPGQRIVVPRGSSHAVWNAGPRAAHVVCELRPALQFESLIRVTLESPPRGRLARAVRSAEIVHAHFDTVRLPFPPARIQRLALGATAALARLVSR